MQRKITDAWPEKAEYTKSWEGLVVRRVIGTGTSNWNGYKQQDRLDFSEKTGTLVNGYRR
jgi:hypothetical protein